MLSAADVAVDAADDETEAADEAAVDAAADETAEVDEDADVLAAELPQPAIRLAVITVAKIKAIAFFISFLLLLIV